MEHPKAEKDLATATQVIDDWGSSAEKIATISNDPESAEKIIYEGEILNIPEAMLIGWCRDFILTNPSDAVVNWVFLS